VAALLRQQYQHQQLIWEAAAEVVQAMVLVLMLRW
jgi:hypothetical protein